MSLDANLIKEKEFKSLKIYNLIVGSILFIQGILMLILANDFKLPITTLYLTGKNPNADFPSQELSLLTEVPIGPFVAIFLLLSGLFLLLVGTIGRDKYENSIKNSVSKFRWIEYSITSSLMIVLIAMLSGVYDLSTLIVIAGANASMILFGWVFEMLNKHGVKKVNWWPYIYGCIIGIVPWIVIFISFFVATGTTQGVPTFVYLIIIFLFIFFMSFGLNIVLQYKMIGKWKNYIYGEWVYITLSLSSKTLLAWMVFGGTLRG